MIMMVMMIVMLMMIDDELMANLVAHSHYTKPNDRQMCIVAQDNNANYRPAPGHPTSSAEHSSQDHTKQIARCCCC